MKKVDSDSGVSRRGLIRAGLSALAGGLLLKFVGANSVTVERVEGANGASVIIGASNTGSSTTTLSSPVNSGPAAYFVNSGTGDAQAIQGNMTGTTGRAFVGYASATTGNTVALDGVNNSTSGIGLRGANTNVYGTGIGVQASCVAQNAMSLSCINDVGYLIAKFKNNGNGVDNTALLQLENGDHFFKDWNIAVAGDGNGLGYTGQQLYIESAGTGAVVTIEPKVGHISQRNDASGFCKAAVLFNGEGTPSISRSFNNMPGTTGPTIARPGSLPAGVYDLDFGYNFLTSTRRYFVGSVWYSATTSVSLQIFESPAGKLRVVASNPAGTLVDADCFVMVF